MSKYPMVKHIKGLKFLVTGGAYNIDGKEITVEDQHFEIKSRYIPHKFYTVDKDGVPKEIK